VIDNDKNTIVIPNQGIEQVMFYMQTMMNDLAVSILRRFDSIAEEIGSMERIESPRKYDESLPKDLKARLHLRYAGRKLKLLGDLYLLAGTYSEAVSNFAAASEETKAINDHFWNAGAQEGLQIALCLQNSKMLNETVPAEAFKDIWNSLPLKLKEIAVLYEKTVMSRLSFELLIQVADIYMKHGDKGEACQALTQAWNSCRPLVVHEKLVVLGTLVVKCERMGLMRKSAFYRNRIAYHLLNLQMDSAALLFITQSLDSFKIEEDNGWVTLKRQMLEKAIRLAEECHEHSLGLSLGFKCLSNTLNTLSEEEQCTLAEMLKIGSAKLHHRKLPPIFVKSSALKVFAEPICNENIRLLEPMMSSPATKPILIFNPFLKKHAAKPVQQKIIIFVGKTIRWLISIRNPFAFQLDLTNIKLITAPEFAVSEEVNVSIEPNELFEFFLNIFPKSAGEFTIEKIAFNIFEGLFTEMPIKSQQFEIFTEQPSLSLSLPDWISGNPPKLELYEGEVKEIKLLIKNDSKHSAKGLNLRAESTWNLPPSSPTLTISESFLPSDRKPVKLRPIADQLSSNESILVTIHLVGIRGNTGNKIILEYVGDEDSASRSILQTSIAQIFTSITQVLSVEMISFFPHTSTRLDRSMEGFIADEEMNKMSLSRAPSGTESPKTLTLQQQIFGGQSTANLADHQDESLNLDPSEWCYASVDLTSHSSLPLFINFHADAHPDTSIRIPSNSSRRIVLPVPRIAPVDEEIDWDSTELSDEQKIILRSIQDNPELLAEYRQLMIKKRLLDNLRLFWSCAAKKTGQMDLRHFQLDPNSISCLTLARHQLKITVNKEAVRLGTVLSLPIGKDSPLTLSFRTRSSHLKFSETEITALVNEKPAELQQVIIKGTMKKYDMAEESFQIDVTIFPISKATMTLSYQLTFDDSKMETCQHPISFVFY
jgi:hypothetical protein